MLTKAYVYLTGWKNVEMENPDIQSGSGSQVYSDAMEISNSIRSIVPALVWNRHNSAS